MVERSSFSNEKDFDKDHGINGMDADAIHGLPEGPLDKDEELRSDDGQKLDPYAGTLGTAELADKRAADAQDSTQSHSDTP